jgi:hypothetical protein
VLLFSRKSKVMKLFSHPPRKGFRFLEFASHLALLLILRDVMKPNILISSY